MEKWHARKVEEAVKYWRTDINDGLSSREVKDRLEHFGHNELVKAEKQAWWRMFIAQFQDLMVLVLAAATLISALLGEYADAATILAIVIINAILGFLQEYRAEKSLDALTKLTAPNARVTRNSAIQQVPARDLVPGDILVLEQGDIVAADARLFTAGNLEIDEAALTGESLPVSKVADRIYPEDITLGDRKNMLYSGTIVTRGRARAVVCSTGMETEVGKIAGLIQSSEEEATPLQKRLDHLGKWLVWGCLGICLLVVATGVVKGEPLLLMCMAGISLAVAAIPEGLPAIVTISLALGIQRMIKQKAIVRKLPAVETLGCITSICSDKTGTLTRGEMTVRQIYAGGRRYEISGAGYEIKGQFYYSQQEFDAKKDKSLVKCLTIGALCNNSILKQNNIAITGIWRKREEQSWSVDGDPTEGALIVAAAKAGIWRENIEKSNKRLAELPFEAERRRMSVVYNETGGPVLHIKGAPDTVLELCRYYYDGEREKPLTPELTAEIIRNADKMTSGALRVLAMAYRRLTTAEIAAFSESSERELVFAGLTGMIDPPRDEAKHAIAVCRQAGIKTIMITGDHRNTAVAIAQELRMHQAEAKAITGAELDKTTDDQLAAIVGEVTVFARVSPSHKLRIVKALKKKGHIVAMTGDGVNDAPAIKEADIGIAMGLSGTDVSREASAMTLADDNFATIVAAVEEGRGIYDNIRKFIRYLLSCNIGEVLTMFVAALAGLPLPLLPVQILWVNLVTDGLPAMALGIDPKEPDIMNRPPRNPAENVFSRGLSRKIITKGFQIGFCTIGVFTGIYLLEHNLQLARTMAFTTLVFCQLFHVYECRSEMLSIFELGLFSNKYLILATGCSVIMQLAVLYLPFLRDIFMTVPLDAFDWLIILTVSGWTYILGLIKYILFRRSHNARSLLSRI